MARKVYATRKGTPFWRNYPERILIKSVDNCGYNHIIMQKDGIRKLVKVHHLVAEAFLGYDPSTYMRNDIKHSLVIDHIDNNKQNNSVANLQIMTQEDNLKKEHGRRKNKKHFNKIQK